MVIIYDTGVMFPILEGFNLLTFILSSFMWFLIEYLQNKTNVNKIFFNYTKCQQRELLKFEYKYFPLSWVRFLPLFFF